MAPWNTQASGESLCPITAHDEPVQCVFPYLSAGQHVADERGANCACTHDYVWCVETRTSSAPAGSCSACMHFTNGVLRQRHYIAGRRRRRCAGRKRGGTGLLVTAGPHALAPPGGPPASKSSSNRSSLAAVPEPGAPSAAPLPAAAGASASAPSKARRRRSAMPRSPLQRNTGGRDAAMQTVRAALIEELGKCLPKGARTQSFPSFLNLSSMAACSVSLAGMGRESTAVGAEFALQRNRTHTFVTTA